MTALLLSPGFIAEFGDRVRAAAREAGVELDVIHLPQDGSALPVSACERIGAAYLTRDMRYSPVFYPAFGDALKKAPALRWVHFASTGIDQHPFLPLLRSRGVRFTTSAGSNGEPVAQTALAGLLMLARGFPRWLAAQRRHAWEPLAGTDVPGDLEGQTVVIVGTGNIGGHLARVCRAIGMRVVGVRRNAARRDDRVDEVHTLASWESALPRCDFVVLACPYTPQTHHLLNAKTLERLPRGAYVVNVSRGAVIDERALIAALEAGHIAGAHLDVFETEPLPSDSPLWTMPNVIVTPHSASASAGNDARAAEIFVANLQRFTRDEPLVNEQ